MIDRCAIHCDQNVVSTHDSQPRLNKRGHLSRLCLCFGTCDAIQMTAELMLPRWATKSAYHVLVMLIVIVQCLVV